MSTRPWRIDAGVADDLSEVLGWSGDDGAVALAARFPERVPCGSTAKLAAIAAGELPPGAEVDAVARQLLDHQLAVVADPAGAPPSPAWSCWVLATVMAALVDRSGIGPVAVAATRRIDERAPVVDLHSAVVVTESGRDRICDPYFGVGVTLPVEVGEAASAEIEWRRADVRRDTGSAWSLDLQVAYWSKIRYRLLGPALDRGDVAAMTAISVSHSGVPSRPYARLHVGGRAVDARIDESGAGLATRWPAAGDTGAPEVVRVAAADPADPADSWASVTAVFAGWTGIRLV